MLKLSAAVAVLAISTAAQAASPRDKLVVGPDWMAAHAADKDLVILHAGEAADFQAGHIPGAQLAGRDALSSMGPGGLVLELPSAADLRTQMQAFGISDGSRIVVYTGKDQFQAATRLLLTLDAAGFGDRAVLLDGGLDAWKRSGRPVTQAVTTPKPGVLSPLHLQSRIVDADFVRTQAHAPGYDIVDARAAMFYDGLSPGFMAPATKRGHIPGAKSVPFTAVMTTDMKLKPATELAATFKAAGVGPHDKLVVYCHVGQQATAVVFAARTLGMEAVLYDGSFQDWAKRDLPVESPAPRG